MWQWKTGTQLAWVLPHSCYVPENIHWEPGTLSQKNHLLCLQDTSHSLIHFIWKAWWQHKAFINRNKTNCTMHLSEYVSMPSFTQPLERRQMRPWSHAWISEQAQGCPRTVPVRGHCTSRHTAPTDTTSAVECPSGHGPNFKTEISILIPEMRRLTRETP